MAGSIRRCRSPSADAFGLSVEEVFDKTDV
jgi:hypothetical protein